MSVLKFKDPQTNEWKEILSIQGAVGPQGPMGPAGNDYVLTEADKQEIAGMIEVPENGNATGDAFLKLYSNMTTLTDEQLEELMYIINNDGLCKRPILVDDTYILTTCYGGGYGGQYTLDFYTFVADANGYYNSSDYAVDPRRIRMTITISTKSISISGPYYAGIYENNIILNTKSTPGGKKYISDVFTYLDTTKLEADDLLASAISYNNTESQLTNLATVQEVLDYMLDRYIDGAYLDNILNNAGYQTEEDVIALIQLYGGGENLTPAEEVEF